MSETYHLAAAMQALIGLFALAVIARLYRGYRLDKLRDRLFALRDETFDYAAANGLLEHPGYQMLRELFNGMLRFCHRLTFMTLIMATALAVPPRGTRVIDEWLSLIDALPPEHRAVFSRKHANMLNEVTWFVLAGSPFGWLLIASMALFGRRNNTPPREWRGWRAIEAHALRV